jgi:hypothetical protein
MDSPPALGESIFTQADSMEGLCDELRDVVECHFGDNEGAMIKLIAIEPKQGYGMLLRFSNGACGTFDFTPFVEAGTEMTEPLRDPAFFKRCFIEAGALAWPNGFDMSAGSLHQRLRDEGKLHRDPKAA